MMPSMEPIQTDNLSHTFILNLRTIIEWTDARLSSSTTLSEYAGKRIDPRFLDCFWKQFILTINLADEPEEHILICTSHAALPPIGVNFHTEISIKRYTIFRINSVELQNTIYGTRTH